MYLKVSYPDDFEELIMHLKSKYPAKLFDLEGIGKQTDLCLFSKEFFGTKTNTADFSVDANSNVDDLSIIAYEKELPKPFFRLNSLYLMWKYVRQLYDHETANQVVEDQISGAIYSNDFHGYGILPYCYNFSTYDIMLQGLPFVSKIHSAPPKHLSSFMGQLSQFVTYASNSVLGAVGLADIFIVMSYYVDKIMQDTELNENKKLEIIKQELQSFIYTVNQPFRGGLQSPFTNVSIMDDPFLESMCPNYIFPEGDSANIATVKFVQKLFLELMNNELKRTPVTFPVVTACFATDAENKIIDNKFLSFIAKQNIEFGFINIYTGKTSMLSSCCRLRSDAELMNEYFNSFGAGSTKIGSMGVVSVNLPRIAIKSKNKEEFITGVLEIANKAIKINNAKRYILKKRIENNNLPLYSLGFMALKQQYSTTGLLGINEAINLLGYNILEEEGQSIVLEMLNKLNILNDKATKQYGYPHNQEQVPAENSSIKLASKDKLLGYQNEYDFYSNQFIPLITNADLLDRIELQGKFDSLMSGGAICHLNVENQIKDPKLIEDLIKSAAKSGVVYFAINYSLQRCSEGHMSVGRKETCECGNPIVSTYTRVVGFLTPVAAWHKVRREQDFPHRQFYEKIN